MKKSKKHPEPPKLKQRPKAAPVANTSQAAKKKPGSKGRSARELTKGRPFFMQLLHNFPDGAISIIDKDFNFIITGGELHKRMIADPADLIGSGIYPKFPEKLREVIRTQLEQVFLGSNLSNFELPYPLKGELYVMDAFPLKEEDGSIAYAGVIIRNISHQKIAKEELNRSQIKEKELGDLKSRFVTMASHEFRTPLSTVLSSACLLKNYNTDNTQENLIKHVNKIISSVNLLNEKLNDFLSAGRIAEGKVIARPKRVNIEDLVLQSIQELNSVPKKGQDITYEHSGQESMVLDPDLMKQIIINLLSNAIKFSAKNAPVEVRTDCTNDQLVLRVRDFGIGIPRQYREHLFERFYRASNALNIEGTGLGLHIVSKYVELMNGSIHYTSEEQRGTEFVVTI